MDMRNVLINFDDVKQVIKTLEKDCGISQDVIKNNLDIKHLLDGQTSMVSNLELLSSPRTALRDWCLESTSIAEIHPLKDENVVVSTN